MPVTIALKFPAGRYHATVWRRHVNDERPEWPPSPWRLFRALAAVWKQRADAERIPAASVGNLFGRLASEPPIFQLPPATLGHTRHYMPERSKPTLVLDRFVAIDRPPFGETKPNSSQAVFVHWPTVQLTTAERSTLLALLQRLTYLGRVESWCDAELTPDGFTVAINSWPSEGGEITTSVLVPHPETWANWDYSVKIHRTDPPWNLLAESVDVQTAGWEVPPGARWIDYSLAKDALATLPKTFHNSPMIRHRPTVARFLLDGPVLPLVTETITVAERFRRAAMGSFRRWCAQNPERAADYQRQDRPDEFASPILSGKQSDGTILCAHPHAHYLPTAEGQDLRRITHVTVFARNGLREEEVSALSSMRRLSMGERTELRVQLVGLGRRDDFKSSLFARSREWTSVTPFLGPAHIGRNGFQRYMRKAISREWRRLAEQIDDFRDVSLQAITDLSTDDPAWRGRPRSFEYRRVRSKHAADGYRPSGTYKLVFSEPVPGPLCLGYASHFGLGLFASAE
jgi:CRISPR-associated protein Csb2